MSSLLATNIDFPWRTENRIHHTEELRVTRNRVDVVFFEEKENNEIGFVVAVEAKLKNWRQAIQQAYRDRLFADRVYVALPDRFASGAIENLSEFRRASIGLIVLTDEEAKIYHHPPINRQRSSFHTLSVKTSLSAAIARDLEQGDQPKVRGGARSLVLSS